jgi:peptidoglycan/LPS O-acetylase OafA/YrhL
MPVKSKLSAIIDLCRALAVSAIFYFHVGKNTRWPLSQYGHYSVGFFVVLAGVAYLCFSRTHVSDWRSYGPYFRDRLWALFPIFLAVNLLLFAASYVYPSGLGRPYTWVELVLSSLGLSQYFGYRPLSVVMWFVPFILQVYLLLPVVHWLLGRVKPVLAMLASFVISFGLAIVVCRYFPDKAEEICVNWSPIFRLPEVVLGVYLGMVLRREPGLVATAKGTFPFSPTNASRRCPRKLGQSSNLRWRGEGVFSAVYAAASFCQMEVGGRLAMPETVADLTWAGLIVGVLVTVAAIMLFAALNRTARIESFRWLGNAAFPFFLIHGVAIRFLYAKYGQNILVWAVYFLVCWLISVAMAMADRWLRAMSLFKRTRRG